MIYAIEADSRTLLFRLDAGELDHLGPRLDFVGDDLTEIGRRADKHRSSEFSELRLYLGIGQASIDFLVQRGDDFVRSAHRRANAGRSGHLIARHEIAHRREVRQHVRSCCSGYRQRAQLAGPYVPDRRR